MARLARLSPKQPDCRRALRTAAHQNHGVRRLTTNVVPFDASTGDGRGYLSRKRGMEALVCTGIETHSSHATHDSEHKTQDLD